MSNGEITNTVATVNTPERQVIAVKGLVHHWIEPWYLAYAILGALASGFAAIVIPLVVINSGGSSTQLGAAIAALNVGALFAPIWGWVADRAVSFRRGRARRGSALNEYAPRDQRSVSIIRRPL